MTDTTEAVTIEGNVVDTAAAAATTAAPVPIETRVNQYVLLRDKIKEMDDAHKAKMKPFRETLDMLNSVLLNQLNTTGAESIKTSGGTIYRTERNTASLEDADKFMQFVVDKEAFDLLDRKANVTAVMEFLGENGIYPPGVKVSKSIQVGVRRA